MRSMFVDMATSKKSNKPIITELYIVMSYLRSLTKIKPTKATRVTIDLTSNFGILSGVTLVYNTRRDDTVLLTPPRVYFRLTPVDRKTRPLWIAYDRCARDPEK